jgi:hypothetical protein
MMTQSINRHLWQVLGLNTTQALAKETQLQKYLDKQLKQGISQADALLLTRKFLNHSTKTSQDISVSTIQRAAARQQIVDTLSLPVAKTMKPAIPAEEGFIKAVIEAGKERHNTQVDKLRKTLDTQLDSETSKKMVLKTYKTLHKLDPAFQAMRITAWFVKNPPEAMGWALHELHDHPEKWKGFTRRAKDLLLPKF